MNRWTQIAGALAGMLLALALCTGCAAHRAASSGEIEKARSEGAAAARADWDCNVAVIYVFRQVAPGEHDAATGLPLRDGGTDAVPPAKAAWVIGYNQAIQHYKATEGTPRALQRTGESPRNSSIQRADLIYVERADHTKFVVWAFMDTVDPAVHVSRLVNDVTVKQSVWQTYLPTTLPYRPDDLPRYALAHFLEGRTVLFLTWDPRYFIIGEQNGRILEQGEGDDVLRRYGEWVPLRLRWVPASVGVTERERNTWR